MRLSFSDSSVNDLIRLRKFIEQHDPNRAQKIARQLLGAIKKLQSFPQIGKWISDLPGEIRDMVFGNYVVRYAVTKEHIYILRIWHGLEHRSQFMD